MKLFLISSIVAHASAFQSPFGYFSSYYYQKGDCIATKGKFDSCFHQRQRGISLAKSSFFRIINKVRRGNRNGICPSLSSSNDKNENLNQNEESGDDDEDNNNNPVSAEQSELLMSLQRRFEEIQTQSDALLSRWKKGKCHSNVRIVVEDDWVRRIALSKWPYVAVGSASGSLYLANVNTCEIVTSQKNVHEPGAQSVDRAKEQKLMLEQMYGDYDGGGTLALAYKGDIVASCGREGGVKVFRVVPLEEDEIDVSSARIAPPPPSQRKRPRRSLDGDKGNNPKKDQLMSPRKKFVSLGEIACLKGTLCTSLVFDEQERLWVGCYDGTVQRFDFRMPQQGQTSPSSAAASDQKPLTIKSGSKVLSLDVNDDVGLLLVGLADGRVKMFSSADGSVLAVWDPLSSVPKLGGEKKKAFIRSVTVATGPNDESWAAVAGTSDGRIFSRQLLIDSSSGTVCGRTPFDNARPTVEFAPGHLNESGKGVPVLCMKSRRKGGLVVTGGQDGTLRVWDCWAPNEDSEEDEDDKKSTLSNTTNSQPDSKRSSYGEYILQPKLLYNLVGYKVWLGSVCVDDEGLRIISDGSDNTCIVHDFSVPLDM